MAKGIDCARPLTATTAKMFASQGVEFVARYLVPERLAWKRMIREEADAISNAGMKVVSVFETSTSRPQLGLVAGTNDAIEALIEAKKIKQPTGTAIYFAADYNVTKAADFDAIEAYLRAATIALPGYEVGIYGEYDVIEEMAKRKACKHFWQTYAWSGGKVSSFANIHQFKNGLTYNGVSYDLDESKGNEGWWSTLDKFVEPAPTAPAPKPIETATDEFKVVVNNVLVTTGKMVDGHIEAPLAAVLKAVGVDYTYNNDLKKLFIYIKKDE